MLKIGDTVVKKVIVKDKNGNIVDNNLAKIVCGGKTVFIKQCNLSLFLYYGYSAIDKWTECGSSYSQYYPNLLKISFVSDISEKVKSIAFTINSYNSDCISKLKGATLTLSGTEYTLSSSRNWSKTDDGYISVTATVKVTFYDDTTTTYSVSTGTLWFRTKGYAKRILLSKVV